jgi:hypothetical protein
VWWRILVIPALWRPRQEDCDFKASLGYIASPCVKKKERKEGRKKGKEREKEERMKD